MAADELYRLVYISRAVELLSIDELDTLLIRAREANKSHGLTGLLLYKDMSFLQVLEGAKSDMSTLFESILNDPRHFRIKVLVDYEPITERSFPEWSMGFQRLSDQDDNLPIGFTDFLDTQWKLQTTKHDHAIEQLNTLLNYFRRHS